MVNSDFTFPGALCPYVLPFDCLLLVQVRVMLRYSNVGENECLSRKPLLVNIQYTAQHSVSLAGPFKDCLKALESGYTTSGMYLLKPDNGNQLMQVWCDQRHDPGGWTVIQRRQDGSVNFFRNWETYKVQKIYSELIMRRF